MILRDEHQSLQNTNQKKLKIKQWAWFCGLWLGGLLSVSIVASIIKLFIHTMK